MDEWMDVCFRDDIKKFYISVSTSLSRIVPERGWLSDINRCQLSLFSLTEVNRLCVQKHVIATKWNHLLMSGQTCCIRLPLVQNVNKKTLAEVWKNIKAIYPISKEKKKRTKYFKLTWGWRMSEAGICYFWCKIAWCCACCDSKTSKQWVFFYPFHYVFVLQLRV